MRKGLASPNRRLPCGSPVETQWSLYSGDAGSWLGDGEVPIFNPDKHLLLDVTVLDVRVVAGGTRKL
jgi:hypothetical protein